MSIRIFLLDDREIVRRGLRDLLQTESDMEVVGEAGTAEEALRRIPATRPEVAVLGVNPVDAFGVKACCEIRSRHPAVRCLTLTSCLDDDLVSEASRAGCSGCLLIRSKGSELVGSIRRVAEGASMLESTMTKDGVERACRRNVGSDALSLLTNQERRLLVLIGEGLSNRQIAERMYLAEKTVKNYVTRLLRKLGLQRRTEVAVLAAKLASTSNGGAVSSPHPHPLK